MAKNITTETEQSVTAYLNGMANQGRKNDALLLCDIFAKQTGMPAKMWGKAIVGFGSYHYKYDSGHEGDAPLVSFSPRASSFALYLCQDAKRKEELFAGLGKYKMSGGCLHIKKLEDVNTDVLKQIIAESVTYTRLQRER